MLANTNKGDGSILELPLGEYKITVTVDKNTDSKPFIAAPAKACEWQRASEHESAPESHENISVAQLVENWLAVKKFTVRPITYASYRNSGKSIAAFFSQMQVKAVSSLLINDYLKSLFERGLKANSIATMRIHLANLFNYAVQTEKIIAANPVHGSMRVRSSNKTLSKTMDENDLKNILRTAKEFPQEKIYPYTYHFLLLAAATGCRKSELLALKWENFDRQKSRVRIAEGLGGRLKTAAAYRNISVDRGIIRRICADIPRFGSYVFSTKGGSRVRQSLLDRHVKLIFAKAGVGQFTLHDIRHAHATILLTHGINVKVVSRRLGHSDVKITLERYTHFVPELEEAAAHILGSNLLV
jgi:integrase